MPDTPTAREIQLWNEWLKTEEGRSYKAGWGDSQNQIYQNQILAGRGHRWVSRRLAKERDELLDALQNLLLAYGDLRILAKLPIHDDSDHGEPVMWSAEQAIANAATTITTDPKTSE